MSPYYKFEQPCALDPMVWLVAESEGASIRRIARYYGVKLSNKQIVQALAAFKLDYSFAHGLGDLLMYLDLQSMGGTDVEWRRVSKVFYASEVIVTAAPAFVAFWRSSVVWLVQWRDELTDEQVQSVLHWAKHRYTEDGHFSFSRRTPSSALAHARDYELEIVSRVEAATTEALTWDAHGWNLAWSDAEGIAWPINELTDQMALAVEGAVQSHCVGSYVMRCVEGNSAILQLLRDGQRTVTIEVHPAEMRIVQAQGRFNLAPSEEARAAIYYWANHFGFNLAP